VFDRHGELALVARADPRAVVAHDAGVWVEESLEHLDVFIVEIVHIVRTKIALFH